MSGDRLILGDFDIAYVDDAGKSCVSEKYENVGSRDWMPGWAMRMLVEDLRPTFDLFSLEKVLWAMVSGRTKMRLWYWKDDEFNLERQFPNDDRMRWINHHSPTSSSNARRTWVGPPLVICLRKVDSVLPILNRSGQVMERHNLTRCTVCRRGPYEEIVGEDNPPDTHESLGLNYRAVRLRVYCNVFHHAHAFTRTGGKDPLRSVPPGRQSLSRKARRRWRDVDRWLRA